MHNLPELRPFCCLDFFWPGRSVLCSCSPLWATAIAVFFVLRISKHSGGRHLGDFVGLGMERPKSFLQKIVQYTMAHGLGSAGSSLVFLEPEC